MPFSTSESAFAGSSLTPERTIHLFFSLQTLIRDTVLSELHQQSAQNLSEVAAVTPADTIYQIDKISEAVILDWFAAHWPRQEIVMVVMEGAGEEGVLVFPSGSSSEDCRWVVIIDPIDGTRNIMYDKRPAWILSALAPFHSGGSCLGDIIVAAMTELPTTRHWRGDRYAAVRGRGRDGIVAESCDLLRGGILPLSIHPSRASDCRHGFASFVKFFPEGKELTARLEERLWDRLYGLGASATPVIFDDQYISTGGQIAEILAGHDRMVADLRPLLLPSVGMGHSLVCHPYDICTSLLLEEAGGVVEQPDGSPLNAPLDTTSPVAWVGYANPILADTIRPVLSAVLDELLGPAWRNDLPRQSRGV